MTHNNHNSQPAPQTVKKIIRFLVLIIVVLIFAVSYFQTQLRLQRKKYYLLENKCTQVRNSLGREEMPGLIREES